MLLKSASLLQVVVLTFSAILLSPVALKASALSFNWDSAALGVDGWAYATWNSSGGDPGGYISSSDSNSFDPDPGSLYYNGVGFKYASGNLGLDASYAGQPVSFDMEYSSTTSGTVTLDHLWTEFDILTPTVWLEMSGSLDAPFPLPGTQGVWTATSFAPAQVAALECPAPPAGGYCTQLSADQVSALLPSLLPQATGIQVNFTTVIDPGVSGGSYAITASLDNFMWAGVPEPSSLVLVATGLAALCAARATAARVRCR